MVPVYDFSVCPVGTLAPFEPQTGYYPGEEPVYCTHMLTTAHSDQEFAKVDEAARLSLARALEGLEGSSRLIELSPVPAAEFRPIPRESVGFVESGLVAVLNVRTVVSVLEPGDLVMSESGDLPDAVQPMEVGSEAGATIRLWDRSALLTKIYEDTARSAHWQRALIQFQSLIFRLNALHIRQTVGLGGQTEVYPPGAVIIRQGDPADDVFSMVEGLAGVIVNEQVVAKVGQGELFGTMAALTGAHRNATVQAERRCTVLRVPKDRFFEIIRTRPEAVQGLMGDMARSITALNEEVVTLRQRLNRR